MKFKIPANTPQIPLVWGLTQQALKIREAQHHPVGKGKDLHLH
jgi:hypothetical protein